jgi:NTE family protein
MHALVEGGIEPDLLVGSSIGALNAAFYATHPGVAGCEALEGAWTTLRRRDVFPFEIMGLLAGFLGFRDHLVAARRLRELIGLWLGIERIEDAPLPFAAVATDALSGEPVVMTRGDVASALLASSAIPGLFPAVRREDRWLVDGSLSAACPVQEALDLGADSLYVLTTATMARRRPPKGAVAMAMNSVSLVTAKLHRSQLESAARQAEARGGTVWVVPSPEPEAPSPYDFRRSRELVTAGYECTNRWLGGHGALTTTTRTDTTSQTRHTVLPSGLPLSAAPAGTRAD